MKPINIEKITDTISISEFANRGFWLHDTTHGMNLAIDKKTKEEALVAALTYYQRRLSEVEKAYLDMSGKLATFVSQFRDEELDDEH